MRFENSFVEHLVEDNNPFPLLWKFIINNIWNPDNNIDSFYGQEGQMKDFELFLIRTFDELYTELLPKYCTGKGYKITLDYPKLFLDSLSIREAVLLKEALQKKRIESKLTYSFSAIPSDTQSYKEKIGFSALKKRAKFSEINNLKSWHLDGDEKIIWSDFPDALLESLSKGKTILSTVTETYKEIENLIFEVITQLNSDKIEIMSDHGYVRHQGAYTFSMNSKDQKKVREALKGTRYAPVSEVGEIPEGAEKFIMKYNSYYMAKGRYVWAVSGKYSNLQHGGVSLMECMTPRLIIEKRK